MRGGRGKFSVLLTSSPTTEGGAKLICCLWKRLVAAKLRSATHRQGNNTKLRLVSGHLITVSTIPGAAASRGASPV